jgi:hypothetical protein
MSSFVEKLDAAEAEINGALKTEFDRVVRGVAADPNLTEAMRSVFVLGAEFATAQIRKAAVKARYEESLKELRRSFAGPTSENVKTGLVVMFVVFVAGFIVRGFLP